jgi:hypothetical protein
LALLLKGKKPNIWLLAIDTHFGSCLQKNKAANLSLGCQGPEGIWAQQQYHIEDPTIYSILDI